ncbi:MAG: energy transducer TonB [Ferruginibacter sp.]
MNIEMILKSDVLDIIFENRNKDYGAYMLRKFYANRLLQSIGIMLLGVIILSAFTFLPAPKDNEIKFDEITLGTVPLPTIIEKKKELPKQPVKSEIGAQKKNAGTPIITANKDVVDSIQTIDPAERTGPITISAGIGNGIIASPGILEGPPAPAVEAPAVITDVTKPISNPDVMPQYPGGISALRKFLERNLQNPRDLEDGEKVSVKITFVVGYDGKLKTFNVTEDGGEVFNNEVLRVLKRMPSWIPGKAKGQNVSVYYTIPVKFIPQD